MKRTNSRPGGAVPKAAETKVERLISRRPAASLLDCCPATLRRMEQRGEIEAIRLSSRSTKYRLSDIQRLIEAAQAGGVVA